MVVCFTTTASDWECDLKESVYQTLHKGAVQHPRAVDREEGLFH